MVMYPRTKIVLWVDPCKAFTRALGKKSHDYKLWFVILCVAKHLPPPTMPKTKRSVSKKSRKRAIREIKRFQEGKSATRMLVPRSCFGRVAREIAAKYRVGDVRFQQEALDNIQEAAETHVVRLLAAANKITACQKRLTLQVSDLQLAREILEDKGLAGMKRYASDAPNSWVMVESPEGSGEDDTDEDDTDEGAMDEDEHAAVQPVVV